MSNQSPALLLIDHGSKRLAANEMLEEIANLVRQQYPDTLVAIAHMELAEPTLAQTVAELASQGAKHIIIHPYFLGPGRHATEDIPNLAKEAAAQHPGITLEITEPLGLHPKIADIIMDRMAGAGPIR